MPVPEISHFGGMLIFMLVGLVFAVVGVVASSIVSPWRPDPAKNLAYECGELPEGQGWVQFNIRFYVMGLIFLIFDAEVLLLFPWAVVFADAGLVAQAPSWGWLALAEAMAFILILLAGLAYIWANGDIRWVRPDPVVDALHAGPPPNMYVRWNESQQATAVRKPVA